MRLLTPDGWSAWHVLIGSTDEGPDRRSAERGSRVASNPMWVGKATGYEITRSRGGGPLVHLVRVRDSATTLRARTARSLLGRLAAEPAGANVEQPHVLPRDAWAARPPAEEITYSDGVRMAFVHHTVSANDYAAADVPAMLRGIQAFHIDVNGWRDIGYNTLIDRYGRIWEGREGGVDEAVVGAHTEGFNSSSTGVALLGTFSDAGPTRGAMDALVRWISWKLPAHGADPSSRTQAVSRGNESHPEGEVVEFDTVAGHRDAKPTACPGQNLYGQLGWVRSEANIGAATALPYGQAWRGGAFVAAGQLDLDEQPELVTGADAGGAPHVRTFDGDGTPRASFSAFTPGFRGGVRVAVAQVNGGSGPGVLVLGAGAGGGPHVRVSGEDGTTVASFFAFTPGFTGGVYVAAGNVDGMPGDEIVVGAGPGGGPHVRVFRVDGSPLADFMAYPEGFRGGVRVAVADVDGDGIAEIVTGAGPGGGPQVRVFDSSGEPRSQWFAYSPNFRGGVHVASLFDSEGDLVVTGAGEGGGPQVRVFDGSGAARSQFFAGRPAWTTGVRVATAAVDGAGVVVTAGGPGGPTLVKLHGAGGRLLFLH